MLRGEMIVMVKCRGEEAGNMLLRRTRMSTHDHRRAHVNVHGSPKLPTAFGAFGASGGSACP